MRTSKFRVWDVRINRMLSWDEMRKRYCDELDFMGILAGDWSDLIPLQYTGLKNKNGVEVYEGDVLKGLTSHYGEIVGEVKLCQYEDDDGFVHGTHYGWNVNGVPLVDLIEQGFEVIGNIHENPELLTD